MPPPHLSRLRVQKYCCKTYSPNVFTTFLQLFFTLLDCQRFINALFFVLLLSTPFFISPSQIINFQSSIINFQKAGVFLSFHAGFSAKDAGFFPFYAYLLNQINGNRFRSSLDLLSIPVYLDWYSSIIYLLYHRRFFFTPFTHLFIHLIISLFLWRVWNLSL